MFIHYAFYVTSLAILVTMTLALIRAMLGPTLFDRVLALNMFGTKTVLLICVIGFLAGPTDEANLSLVKNFLDLALLYSLMNFIGMVALLRFSEYGNFRDQGMNPRAEGKQ